MSNIVCSKIDKSSIGLLKNDVGIVRETKNKKFKIFFIRIKKVIDLLASEIKLLDPNDFGDQKEFKICNKCHTIKPTSQFEKNQNGINNRPVRRPSCKQCRELMDGESISNSEKKYWLNLKPNLVDFKCPICNKITIPGLTSKVVLNHDHRTGKVTGWICDSCNTGLGRFQDNEELLLSAIDYIKKHS